jgi:catechol 2,3-dioxygenase-like lactoylglutathione lyase family enzyme
LNAPALVEFYRDVIGLEPYATIGSATFLKIDEASEGHPQLLAIFDKSHSYSGPKAMQLDTADASVGTLHHFAFIIDQKDFDSERDRLEGANIEVQANEHAQFGWRSLYMHDPDGNSVELVCYDEAILDAAANQRAKTSGNTDND